MQPVSLAPRCLPSVRCRSIATDDYAVLPVANLPRSRVGVYASLRNSYVTSPDRTQSTQRCLPSVRCKSIATDDYAVLPVASRPKSTVGVYASLRNSYGKSPDRTQSRKLYHKPCDVMLKTTMTPHRSIVLPLQSAVAISTQSILLPIAANVSTTRCPTQHHSIALPSPSVAREHIRSTTKGTASVSPGFPISRKSGTSLRLTPVSERV